MLQLYNCNVGTGQVALSYLVLPVADLVVRKQRTYNNIASCGGQLALQK